MPKLPGKDTSLWLDTTPKTNFTELADLKHTLDVAVVGGGIAGILTAWYLQQIGLKVAIIEKARIIENTTGNTTAKLTSQHNLVYAYLIRQHGRPAARAFGEANQQAIEDIFNLSKQLAIDCDFERAEAYVFTQRKDKLEAIKQETEAAKSLGLPASFETKTDLPFSVKGAIKFANQAQFHPRKFLLGVIAELRKNKVPIFEQTEALDIKPGSVAILKTNKGELKAKYIVGATKYPFWRQDLFEDKTWVKLSYALGVLLKGDYPQQMYISAEEPVRTIRSHPYKAGRILIFGGESHLMTKDYNKDEHYQNLIDDVKRKFKVKQIVYRWIAGDMMPNDKMPYIGAYPGESNIFVITGFHAWGLGWGMAAAQMIRDEIAKQPNQYKQFFSLSR
ncbi:FAD-binding oxidoreductase [Candidatus Saccharibacteria bacterium]|nr:FAD-binding oxidoreductase [Candidatus Saccharibacteria bacterium]